MMKKSTKKKQVKVKCGKLNVRIVYSKGTQAHSITLSEGIYNIDITINKTYDRFKSKE